MESTKVFFVADLITGWTKNQTNQEAHNSIHNHPIGSNYGVYTYIYHKDQPFM